MRLPGMVSVAALLALLAAAAPGTAAAPDGETQQLPLTIAFTGDVIGYLEPCG